MSLWRVGFSTRCLLLSRDPRGTSFHGRQSLSPPTRVMDRVLIIGHGFSSKASTGKFAWPRDVSANLLQLIAAENSKPRRPMTGVVIGALVVSDQSRSPGDFVEG